jgi:hypothetical protein
MIAELRRVSCQRQDVSDTEAAMPSEFALEADQIFVGN